MQLIEMERKHKKEVGDIMERLDKMEKDFDIKIESLEKMIKKLQPPSIEMNINSQGFNFG
jgi:hypothetical protein